MSSNTTTTGSPSTSIASTPQSSYYTTTTQPYPEVVCIQDRSTLGLYYQLDGRYLQQATELNQRPIWTKEQLLGVIDEYYLFLHIDAANASFWVISSSYPVSNLVSDANVQAYCNQTVHDASLCTQWHVFDESTAAFVLRSSDQFDSSNPLCHLSNAYLCVQSNQEFMTKYIGSYHQVHDAVTLWRKENVDNNDTAAIMHLDILPFSATSSFVVHSIIDLQLNALIAFCKIYDSALLNYNDSLLFEPWQCDEWYVLDPNRTGSAVSDKSMNVQFSSCSSQYVALCMNSNNDSNPYSSQQYLFGVWRVDKIAIDGHYSFVNDRIQYTLFWNASTSLWSIVDTEHYSTIAVCDTASALLPSHCACWLLLEDSTMFCGAAMSDAVINGNAVQCIDDEIASETDVSASFCIESAGNQSMASGVYNREFDAAISDRYYWVHTNAETPDQSYTIVYNDFYRFWVYTSTDLDSFSFWCLEYDALDPMDCSKWYKSRNSDDHILVDIELCSNESNDAAQQQVVILAVCLTVGGLLLLIVCFVLVRRRWKKIQRQREQEKTKPRQMYAAQQEDFPQLPDFAGADATKTRTSVTVPSVATEGGRKSTFQKLKDRKKTKSNEEDDGERKETKPQSDVEEDAAIGYLPNSYVSTTPASDNPFLTDWNEDDNAHSENEDDGVDPFEIHEFGIRDKKEIEMVPSSVPKAIDILATPPEQTPSAQKISPITPYSPNSSSTQKKKRKKKKRDIHYDDGHGLDL
eukprot:CAMPEP_0197077686 /NCGR_PEP_ID=MMETSP1384-20130603/212743_1 /TAXON_ID=29189 /ORGANISM="Ammonia sp." /LENGTH=746 /DNA_ID=CAMNT_0042516551 /DNA_START=17 /DNA_END=2257 /DNA_ORIENTATION=-